MKKRSDKFILDAEGNVRPADLKEWGTWFESAGESRIVQQDRLENGVFVSTVFLGLDHNFSGQGPPILWESMIFKGPHDGEMRRYSSLEDARAGHSELLAMAQEE